MDENVAKRRRIFISAQHPHNFLKWVLEPQCRRPINSFTHDHCNKELSQSMNETPRCVSKKFPPLNTM